MTVQNKPKTYLQTAETEISEINEYYRCVAGHVLPDYKISANLHTRMCEQLTEKWQIE